MVHIERLSKTAKGFEPRLSNISAGIGLVVVLLFGVASLLVGVGPRLAVEEPRQVLVVVQLKDEEDPLADDWRKNSEATQGIAVAILLLSQSFEIKKE